MKVRIRHVPFENIDTLIQMCLAIPTGTHILSFDTSDAKSLHSGLHNKPRALIQYKNVILPVYEIPLWR